MTKNWFHYLEHILDEQLQADLGRDLKSVTHVDGPEIEVEGRRVVMFCSNDYLGYTQHPALKKAAKEAVDKWGVGSGASRLVSGNLKLYDELEAHLARFKHASSALVFPTGFMANLGVVASLAGPNDLILSDSLNHASLVDACRLSRAEVKVVPHADPEAYADAIKSANRRKVMIVTDGVFSMDGDLAPMRELSEIAHQHGALLVMDDAHGTGVLGETGRGTLEYLEVDTEGIIQAGTFSKALGSLGGFVAGPAPIIGFLRNRARTLFYTTALPAATLAVNQRALELVDEEPETRRKLMTNISRLRHGLSQKGLTLLPGQSSIVPVMVGEAGTALNMAKELMTAGLFCPAMRPPTVPQGQCRLRLSVMATHTDDHIDRAVDTLADVSKRMGLI
jgi:8-amino-7-oxononanoate synthase